jgi:hypothetical protein
MTRDADELEALERSLLDADVRGSRERLDRLLEPGFFEYGGSGRVYDRAGIVEALVAAARTPSTAELSADRFDAHPLGPDVVLLTFRTTRRDAPGAAPVHALRSSIWRRTEGRWRLVFHQATPTQVHA